MVNFNDIKEARKLLGLGEAATLNEVRITYRGGSILLPPQISTQPAILLSMRKK